MDGTIEGNALIGKPFYNMMPSARIVGCIGSLGVAASIHQAMVSFVLTGLVRGQHCIFIGQVGAAVRSLCADAASVFKLTGPDFLAHVFLIMKSDYAGRSTGLQQCTGRVNCIVMVLQAVYTDWQCSSGFMWCMSPAAEKSHPSMLCSCRFHMYSDYRCA
jgi:hypothetical protein